MWTALVGQQEGHGPQSGAAAPRPAWWVRCHTQARPPACGRADEHGEYRLLRRTSTVASAVLLVGMDGMRAQLTPIVCHLLVVVCMQLNIGPASIASYSRMLRVAHCTNQRQGNPVSRALMSGLSCGACRWPSWECACVPGTKLSSVLDARNFFRYCLDCLTTVFPITPFSAYCRIRRAFARNLPAAPEHHAIAVATRRPFAW